MLSTVTKYFTVCFSSMFKFILGPIIGPHEQLSLLETTICTIIGMMTSVIIISYIGENIRDYLIFRKKKKGTYKVFTRRKRRIVRVFQKFGMGGIAFLTPLLLTPIGGTVIAVSLHINRRKIILYMFISALFWTPIAAYFFAHLQPVFFPHLRAVGI